MDLKQKLYGQLDISDNIDGMLKKIDKDYGISIPSSALLSSDPYTNLGMQTETGRYVGIAKIGPYRCHHLAFTQPNLDWEIWITDAKDMAPRKMTIIYKTTPKKPRYTINFVNWTFKKFPDNYFKPRVNRNYQKIEILPAT